MIKLRPVLSALTCVVAITAIVCLFPVASTQAKPAPEEKESGAESGFAAVDDMHHFMEYINEPVFNALKEAIDAGPPAKKAWGAIKSSSMILAESSILLAQRTDNKADEAWQSSSMVVHRSGTQLYQAARKKDFDGVKKHFAAMSKGCTSCHETYR